MAACDVTRSLKILIGLTHYEYARKVWTSEPERFIVDLTHHMP